MLQAYIFWARACYLLLQDLSKCAEKEKIYSTYLTALKPGIILLGCQPRALRAPHSPIFKTKRQFPTQPKDKARPGNSSGLFFLAQISTILDTGLLNVMEGGVCVPDYLTLQLLCWGQCQLPWQFTTFITNQTALKVIYTSSSDSNYCWWPDLAQGVTAWKGCVWSSRSLTFAVSIWIRVLTMTSLIDIAYF